MDLQRVIFAAPEPDMYKKVPTTEKEREMIKNNVDENGNPLPKNVNPTLTSIYAAYLQTNPSWRNEGKPFLGQQLQINIQTQYWPLLTASIPTLSSDELAALVELGHKGKKPSEDIKAITNRFLELIMKELSDPTPGFIKTETGFKVQNRILETHTFTKIVHYLSKLDLEGEAMNDPILQGQIQSYLVKEQKNMSFEDIIIVLNSMLTNGNLTSFHTDFVTRTLPNARIRNLSTLTVLLDFIGGFSVNNPAALGKDSPLMREILANITNQLPYISDFPNVELVSYIPLAAMSMAQAGVKLEDEILNPLMDVFMQFRGFLNERETVLFLEASNVMGVDLDDTNFMNIIQEFLSEVEIQKDEDIISSVLQELLQDDGVPLPSNKGIYKELMNLKVEDFQYARLERVIWLIHGYQIIKKGEHDELMSRLIGELNKLLMVPNITTKLTNQVTLYRFVTLLERYQKYIPKAAKILEESNYQAD